MICETGVAHYSIPNGENVEAWGAANLEKFYSMLPVVYPRVKAITYLSLNQANDNYLVGNRWSNYALSENEQVKETYKRIIQSDTYLSEVQDYDESSAEAQYYRVEKDTLFNQEELVLDIKVPDYRVSKVSVFSDTGYMKVMTQMPFVIDQEALRGQVLNVQVFDSTGKLVMNELIEK
jgi:Asp-tRNA(Asn)/Glu-tRNA(Gln) amidotransferase A subunit family amidase